ncbi:hypothetical protein ACFQO4_19195 [Saliphagus sp. GCM10025334]
MTYSFWKWLSCPVCDERDDVKMMAYRTDIVLECYECGQMSEYTIGEDIPIHQLDIDAIAERAGENNRD